MVKKRLYSMIAKLAAVFIVLSSVPVYASGDTADPPCITKLEDYIYADRDKPDRVSNVYNCKNPDQYGYSPDEDAATPYNKKRYVYFPGVQEKCPKVTLVITTNRSDVEFEYERLDRETGEVEYTTGRTADNFCVCEQAGNIRIHVYATDGSGYERIYYSQADGLDCLPPEVTHVRVSYMGQSKPGRNNGTLRYGFAKVTVTGAVDRETRLHEKPYMYGYPNGEWVAENECSVRPGVITVATRDRVGNFRTDTVEVHYIDADPPMTTFEECDTPTVNGFKRLIDLKVETEEETDLPEDYLSFDGENWFSGDTVEISENGVYDIYTRDVFEHVSENTIEVDNIDSEPPQYSYNIEHISRGGGCSREEILHVIAADSKCGLGPDAYSYDGGNTWVSENSLAISENGAYCVRVRDALGNESEDTHIEVNDIDNKRPVITSISENRLNTSGIYAAASQIIVTAQDEGSGLADEGFFFDGRGSWSSEGSFTVSKNGIVNVRVRDRVGNTESTSIKIENLDPDAPECIIRGNPENLTMSKINLKVEVKDMLSGVRNVYISDPKVGMKKLIKEYQCDEEGAGERNDTLDVEITSNGQYLFYVTDMCGNEKRESVTVTKILKSKNPGRPQDPEDPYDGGDEGGSGGSGSTPDIGRKDGKGSETVVIGAGNNVKTGKDSKNSSGITVKNKTVSEDKISGSSREISENRYSRYDDPDAGAFGEDENASGNELTDAYEGDDFSTDIFESEKEEYFSENSPQELEMIPDPDGIETTGEDPSKAGTIAATVVLMVTGLSVLTVFLLAKKGLITIPDLFGKKAE